MKLLDAAMGTRLMARGLDLATSDPCLWNLTHLDSVLRIHSADLAAGAQCLCTNTFGANRYWLDRFASGCRIAEVNQQAVAIARQAISNAGKKVEIAGSIGPTAFFSEETLREQVEVLTSAGVNRLIFETLAPETARQLCRWRIHQNYPVEMWASLFNWGKNPQDLALLLQDSGFAAVGLNCVSDKRQIIKVLRRVSCIEGIRLFLKPSRMNFQAFLSVIHFYQGQNLVAVGGCCGTDEHWIRMLAAGQNGINL